jgi:hypothetical protein
MTLQAPRPWLHGPVPSEVESREPAVLEKRQNEANLLVALIVCQTQLTANQGESE